MDAIVLAAGEGKRFFGPGFEERPLPDGLEYPIPKTLYPVSVPGSDAEPRPVLAHLVDALIAGSIEHVFIGTGHLAEKIAYYVEHYLQDKPIEVIPPNESIDYRIGPLYTLAGVLQYFLDNDVFGRKDLDKVFMLCPSDFLFDRRAVWYLAGNSARGMMASRFPLHVLVETRDVEPRPEHSTLQTIVPERFQGLFPEDLLACPLIPLMGVHLDILLESVTYLNRGETTFASFLKAWLDETIDSERQFQSTLNVMATTGLGERFYWFDLDSFAVIAENNL
jgi:choline kinase